jgi:hypothetical protein
MHHDSVHGVCRPITGQPTDGGATEREGRRRPPAPPPLPELVSGHYLLDFGYVTKGINKSKKVKITNLGTQPVSTQ